MHRASNQALRAIHKHTALLSIASRGLFFAFAFAFSIGLNLKFLVWLAKRQVLLAQNLKVFFALLFADWTLVVEQAVAKRRLLRHFVPRNDGMHKASAVIASEARHSSRYVIATRRQKHHCERSESQLLLRHCERSEAIAFCMWLNLKF